MQQAEQILKQYFGYDEFRQNQREVIEAVLNGRDVLAVMPTGAGKSICYQVPALCSDGLTLVVSPLISLMKDQVSALEQAGVGAAFLNSSLSLSAREDVLKHAAEGEYALLYVSPERLDNPSFCEFCKRNPPAIVAIDEAHCISQWGQDFRPSYTRIEGFVNSLPKRPVVCAFTATATQTVREDILDSLQLQNPLVVIGDFDRPNLHFEVQRGQDKDDAVLDICLQRKNASGIVYCTSRRAVEEVCDFLNDGGVSATRYHAGLSTEERKRNQEDFVFDRKPVIVATSAFGMGIDKSNVSFVVHYNMPLDLESYYQEAGRAGRDGEPADCILLYAPRDVEACKFLLSRSNDNDELDVYTRAFLEERAHERLKLMTYYSTTTDCLRRFILRYFGQETVGYCGNCGNCETEFEKSDVTQDAQKIVSCVYRLMQRNRTVGKTLIVDILRASKAERILSNGYDELSTYGIMKGVSASYIRFVMDALIEHEILGYSGGQYPVVTFTKRSGEFLIEREAFIIKVPKEREDSRQKASKRAADAARLNGEPYDEELYELLRALRNEIALEQGVAAFIVFTNAALKDMCRRMPERESEFLEVNGVGKAKAQRYGKRFLDAIRDYRTGKQTGSE